MSGDLISREALKKALEEYKYCGFYDKVIEIIDNTPTVDIKDEIAGAYNEGYTCGSKEAEKAKTTSNFCPNCGADMKGGADNDVS